MALKNTNYYKVVNLKLRKLAFIGLILLTMVLYVPALDAQVKNEHIEWSDNSPTIHYVELQDGDRTLKGEVRISYFLFKKGHPYYRRARTPDRVFGEAFDIYDSDIFKVKIEFKTFPKEKPVDNLFLLIPSNSWLSAGGCFLEPNLQELPLKVAHGRRKEITFQLQADCNELSKIQLDFKFSKDGRKLSFKTDKSRKGKFKGKKKSREQTSVSIPLIVKKAALIAKDKSKKERTPKNDAKTEKSKSTVIKERQPSKPNVSKKEKIVEVPIVTSAPKKKSTGSKKSIKKTTKEKDALKEAKEMDTVEAFEIFIKRFPKSKQLTFVENRIQDIQELDERAWKIASTNNTKPCDQISLLETYLQNNKHHTKYRSQAETEKQKATSSCITDIRIQNSSSQAEQGHYTFEIINGKAPYSATVNNKDANIRVEGKHIILDILEGGNYELTVSDQSPTPLSYEYELEAIHPDFEIELQDEQVLIRGGQSSFLFATDDNSDQYQVTERKIKLNDLVDGLNRNSTFDLVAVDLNGNQSNKIQIAIAIAQNTDSNLGKIGGIAFILALLASTTYFLKDKVASLFQKPNVQEEEEEGLWKMAEENTDWKIYEIYKKEYPAGKHIKQLTAIKLEFDFWEKCQQNGNYSAYLQNYGTGRFRELAEKKLSER